MVNQKFMSEAIQLATESIDTGGGPFGAVIVHNGKVIGRGQNRVTQQNDPTAHAEVQAIRDACKHLNTFDLSECEIYTSCEPCPMCFSAIYWSHISTVYYSASHADAEKVGFDDAFIYREIKLPMAQRSVLFVRNLAERGTEPFDKWIKFDGKIAY